MASAFDALPAATLSFLREIALALNFWPYSLPLLIVLGGMAGVVGHGLGLHNLFRDDDQLFNRTQSWRPIPSEPGPFPRMLASPAFWSGFGFMATFGLFWIVAHSSRHANCGTMGQHAACPTELYQGEPAFRGAAFGHMSAALAVALLVLVLLNYTQLHRLRADFEKMGWANRLFELLRLAAGAAVGIAVTLVGYWLPFILTPLVHGGPPAAEWLASKSYALPQACFAVYVLSGGTRYPAPQSSASS